MGKQKNKHPVLKPHVEGEYLEEVVVLRIPAGTPSNTAREATQWQSNIAKKINQSRKDLWWMEERQYAKRV
jgi:hypothetical protein